MATTAMAPSKEKMATKGRGCPVCGKDAVAEFRPFCSRRCADVDLNRWLSGVYAVPVTEDTDEDGTGEGKPSDEQH